MATRMQENSKDIYRSLMFSGDLEERAPNNFSLMNNLRVCVYEDLTRAGDREKMKLGLQDNASKGDPVGLPADIILETGISGTNPLRFSFADGPALRRCLV